MEEEEGEITNKPLNQEEGEITNKPLNQEERNTPVHVGNEPTSIMV